MRKTSLLFLASLLIIAVLSGSCSLSVLPENNNAAAQNPSVSEAEAKTAALGLIMPIVNAYAQAGEAQITGYSTEDFGSGLTSEIPEMTFASAEAESRFYGECEKALQNGLGDSYRYVCEDISPVTGEPLPAENGKYTTLLEQTVGSDKLGADMKSARILIRRHWVLKYYVTLEVDSLDDQCASLYVQLRTNKGDTHSASATYEKSLKVKSSEYKKSQGGNTMSAAYSFVRLTDPTIPGDAWSHNFSSGSSQPGPSAYSYYDKNLSGSYSMTLRHVYYKNSSGDWSWNTGIDGYSHFKNNLTENNDIKHMFAGYLRNPPASSVKNLVLCIAGQQGSQADSTAVPSVATGQYDDWHHNGDITDQWRTIYTKSVSVNKTSMAGQLYYDMASNSGNKFGLKYDDTFLGVVFDSTFYYGLSSSKKTELEKAFAEWLLSQTSNLAGVKNIYLVGASMGGGLSTRIAEYIRDDYANRSSLTQAQVIVSCFDGVGNTGVDLEIERDGHSSPYTTLGNKCWEADLPAYFANESNTHIYQISGGDAVVDILSDARGFWVANSGSFTKFTWVSLKHTDIGRKPYCPNIADQQLEWFMQNRNR